MLKFALTAVAIVLAVGAGSVALPALLGNENGPTLGPPMTPRAEVPPATVEAAPPNTSAPARIYIPALSLATPVFTSTAINAGPSWWKRTGRPGGGDTVAIAGHRTTYTRPFYYLETLEPGDLIYVAWRGETTTYRVTGRRILSAKQMHIVDARGYEILLLSACTPRGSAKQRIVVYARPV